MLPTNLSYIKADTKQVVERFYKACVGWIRYKPLYVYITDRENYEEKMAEVRARLKETLPKVCRYFGRDDFMNVLEEFEQYHRNVRQHYRDFQDTKAAWRKMTAQLVSREKGNSHLSCFGWSGFLSVGKEKPGRMGKAIGETPSRIAAHPATLVQIVHGCFLHGTGAGLKSIHKYKYAGRRPG